MNNKLHIKEKLLCESKTIYNFFLLLVEERPKDKKERKVRTYTEPTEDGSRIAKHFGRDNR